MSERPDTRYDVDRLRWQCRRGMLELDYLLLEFLEQQFNNLTSEEKLDFVRLLGEADQDLQRWLVGGLTPIDGAYAHLIRKLFDGRPSSGSPTN